MIKMKVGLFMISIIVISTNALRIDQQQQEKFIGTGLFKVFDFVTLGAFEKKPLHKNTTKDVNSTESQKEIREKNA